MNHLGQPSIVSQSNPKAGYLAYRAEIDEAIQRVLQSGWYILGKEVAAFEQEFANYLSVNHAVGLGNGTDALELALRACEVSLGDLVFTVSHTAVATVAAIELVGAIPVLVDIDPEDYTMDPSSLGKALKKLLAGTPKAIIPVHLYGNPVDMPAILEIAHHHGLRVIEDCAQSHGATLNGRMTGSWGDIAAFSFYPTKNLGALGDGGMVVTNDDRLAEQVRLLQQYGWRQRYISDVPGGNSRLDELQAAILRVKLRHLESETTRRCEIAGFYDTSLANSGLSLPVVKTETRHVYHQYVVRSRQRDSLATYLRQKSIGTLIHYPVPIHLQPAYSGRLPRVVPLPHTEAVAAQVLSLPIYPQLSETQIGLVSSAILEFDKERMNLA